MTSSSRTSGSAWNGSFSSSLKIGRPPGSGSVSAASRSGPYAPLSRFFRTRARTSARIASRSTGGWVVIRAPSSTFADLPVEFIAKVLRNVLTRRLDADERLRRREHPAELGQATLLGRHGAFALLQLARSCHFT